MFNDIVPQTIPFFAGGFSSLVFLILTFISTRGHRSKSFTYMKLILAGMTSFYFIWAIPPLFTRDEPLYTLIFNIGDLITHITIFMIGLFFWHFVFRGNSSKLQKYLHRVYVVALAAVGSFSYLSILTTTLKYKYRFEDNNLVYEVDGPMLLAYATYLLPVFLFGIYFLILSVTAKTFRARLKSLAIGSTAALISGASIVQNLGSYPAEGLVKISPGFTTVTYIYIFFFSMNLFVFFYDKKLKQRDK